MPAPITIMTVDDDPDMRFLVRAVLEGTDLEVVAEATSGDEALAMLRAMPEAQRPTVILLDNLMPGLGGLETAARIHRFAPGSLVVLSSSHVDDALEQQAADAHVTECVSKGDALDLPAIITRIVAAHRRE